MCANVTLLLTARAHVGLRKDRIAETKKLELVLVFYMAMQWRNGTSSTTVTFRTGKVAWPA